MGLYDTTIGPLLLGIFVNTFLYGIVTYQFAVYHRTKFNDPPALKYSALFLFILDTFHSGAVIYMAWYYVVTNFSNPAAFQFALWPYAFTPAAIALAALVTHIYLAMRIWRLTRSRLLYYVAILLAILSCILAVVTTVIGWMTPAMSEASRLTPFATTWLSAQVVADTFITVTLVIVFSRSRTGFRKTDKIVNRLIRGAIQTGLFASIFSLGNLVSFIALPGTDFYGMFAIPIGRIYTNALLDTLLTREMLKGETDGAENTTSNVVFDSVYWLPTDSHSIPIVQSITIPRESQRATEGRRDHSLPEDKISPVVVVAQEA